MTTNKLSYTNRDISSIRRDIINLVKSYGTSWTDFNESDIGMTYIEVLAGVIDMLGFYLDKQALENYLGTVTQPKNANAILRLLNILLTPTVSEVCYVEFTVNDEYWDRDIMIPKYTRLTTKSEDHSIKYFTTEESYIPKGTRSVTVKAMQGEYREMRLKVSDMTKQKILLEGSNIAVGSVELWVDGEKWTEVPDVFLTNRVAKEYSLAENKNNAMILTLSYGYESLLPRYADAPIVIKYALSLGPEGKVAKGAVNTIQSQLYDTEGAILDDKVLVRNIEASSGGAHRQSITEAKTDIPKVTRTMYTAVTLSDYEVLTKSYPGVLKAVSLDWSVSGNYVTNPYHVDSYIVPEGGGDASKLLLDGVYEYIRKRSVSCNQFKVYTAEYVPVDIVADVVMTGTKTLQEDIRRGLEKELEEYFAPENQEFGKGYRVSNIYTLLQSYHPSINYVDLKSPTSNLDIKLNQFPKLGSVTLNIINNSVHSENRGDIHGSY